MSGQSDAPGEIISVPQGSCAENEIGEKFSADLYTGTGNFTIPSALPAGRNGFRRWLNLLRATDNANGALGLSRVPVLSRNTSYGAALYGDLPNLFLLLALEI